MNFQSTKIKLKMNICLLLIYYVILLQKLLSRHKEQSEKAKEMMERLKTSNLFNENSKTDSNVMILIFTYFHERIKCNHK